MILDTFNDDIPGQSISLTLPFAMCRDILQSKLFSPHHKNVHDEYKRAKKGLGN